MRKIEIRKYSLGEGGKEYRGMTEEIIEGNDSVKATYVKKGKNDLSLMWKESYSFGKLKEWHFYKDGNLDYKDIMAYDEDGKLCSRKGFRSDIQFDYINKMEAKPKNPYIEMRGEEIVVCTEYRNGSGRLISKNEVEYNKYSPYLAVGSTRFVYNHNEQLISKTFHEEFEQGEEGYEPVYNSEVIEIDYYRNGYIKEIRTIENFYSYKDGLRKKESVIISVDERNELGDVIRITSNDREGGVRNEEVFKYEYNSDSIWILQRRYNNGRLINIYEKTITEDVVV